MRNNDPTISNVRFQAGGLRNGTCATVGITLALLSLWGGDEAVEITDILKKFLGLNRSASIMIHDRKERNNVLFKAAQLLVARR